MGLSEELRALDRIRHRGVSLHSDINFRSNCKRLRVKGVLVKTRFGTIRIISHPLFDDNDVFFSESEILTGRKLLV